MRILFTIVLINSFAFCYSQDIIGFVSGQQLECKVRNLDAKNLYYTVDSERQLKSAEFDSVSFFSTKDYFTMQDFAKNYPQWQDKLKKSSSSYFIPKSDTSKASASLIVNRNYKAGNYLYKAGDNLFAGSLISLVGVAAGTILSIAGSPEVGLGLTAVSGGLGLAMSIGGYWQIKKAGKELMIR